MANLIRKIVEEEYDSPEMAHKYNKAFQNAKNNEHEKFLKTYMQVTQANHIKDSVRQFSGTDVFFEAIWERIKKR